MKRCDPSERPLSRSLLGQRVWVALHFVNRCYTVSIGGKVRGYTPALRLRDVATRVRPGGYEECRASHQRNVHAWLLGELVDAGEHLASVDAPAGWRRFTYRCKDGPPAFFYPDDGEWVIAAHEVLAQPSGVWAAPAGYEVIVQTMGGPYRWAPYTSRDAALAALPGLQRLQIPRVIKGTWQVLALHAAGSP
jgi:hypothetical protein